MSSPLPDPSSASSSNPPPSAPFTPAQPTSADSGSTTPNKSQRPKWLLPVGIGCAALLLLALFIGVLGIVLLLLRGPGPAAVAEDFTVGTLEGDCEKVMKSVTPELRGDMDCSDITEQADSENAQDVSFQEVSTTDADSTATVVADVSYTTDDGPESDRLEFELQKIDGDWKVVDAHTK